LIEDNQLTFDITLTKELFIAAQEIINNTPLEHLMVWLQETGDTTVKALI
jgi:hypothetical protein